MNSSTNPLIPAQIIEEATQWAIMHGVAFRQADNSARHCPFSIAPITMQREVFQHLQKVTPLITKLINNVSEDHDFLQAQLADVAKADPFIGRLFSLHQQAHGDAAHRLLPARKPLLLMRTDFMDDRQHGAKVIEFNGIAAGMAPFGQRGTEFHAFLREQWPQVSAHFLDESVSTPAENHGLDQFAYGISIAAKKVNASFTTQVSLSHKVVESKPTFLMVIQDNEDNVYDQHLLEVALNKQGLRTVRRTFEQLSTQLSTGENQRLVLDGVGAIDAVYLRAGYQYSDYYLAPGEEAICCQTLSQTRLFIEQHYVAVNATFSQQLASSKTMQMLLTMMPAEDFARWDLDLEQARLVKSVLADMKPINQETINWFNSQATKQEWVLKNQGEGGGHCVFGDDIVKKLEHLPTQEYDAWALMLRLYPHERELPTIAVRDGVQTQINDLVSEIGLFTAFYDGEPVTEMDGYAGYLIRSKPASENEGGIHSGKGILDSLMLSN
ncbi:glutathione synthase [Alginatibacterium sediminis]|uniref:glutathione synthase n=1 Tax=Alginatibacterium sediminis TaxID=2164068 RepID=A0A420EDF0_9ALTE|nr:glutathione synthase [Alginatibacterium sediminis]RKF18698.1 glutathione synthase [Alginatibacterium sediminis]